MTTKFTPRLSSPGRKFLQFYRPLKPASFGVLSTDLRVLTMRLADFVVRTVRVQDGTTIAVKLEA